MKLRTLIGVAALTSASFAQAGFMLDTNEWTIFGNDNGHVGPGVGGQAFDAEFLFYKVEGNSLTVGLQTGFDIIDGMQTYSDGRDYFAGDIALSFDGADGSPSSYEYGIDFGFLTKGWSGAEVDSGDDSTGIDAAGLYAVDGWSNDVYRGHHISDPFAIDDGSFDRSITSTSGSSGTSHYRTATFDLTGLVSTNDPFDLDAHWTMSCGNDYIDGHADDVSVPEPESIALLALGLIGLGLARRRVAK